MLRGDAANPDGQRGALNGMSSVYARALKRAAEIVGGETEFARQLSIPAATLRRWTTGETTPPMEVFLKAVDVITAHDIAAGGGKS